MSRFSRGRLKVVALVCLVAVLALPTLAFASGTPTTAQTVSSVKVTWTPAAAIKTLGAKIAVNGEIRTATVAADHLSAYAYFSLSDGAKSVVASGKDNVTGALVSEPWSFSVSAAPKFGAVTPGNGQSLTATPTAITVKYSDNSAVTAVTAATVNGTPATVTFSSTGATLSVGAVAQGWNAVSVSITDAAGNVVSKNWGFMNTQALTAAACTKCHSGPGVGLGSTMKASGHNTTENGVIGGKTKFDGSQGVTLHWTAVEAFTVTSVKDPDALAGATPGTAFTLGQTGTVISIWSLPTKSVFWPAVNDGVQDAPGTAIKGLSWNSVITCEDCHTGFNATGPHGANSNFGLDSNYPGDYSRAVLTKRVTSGDTYGGRTNVSPSGIAMLSALTTQAVVPNNFGNGTSGADAVICAKCHRLMTTMPAGTGPGQSDKAWNVVVGASTPHNSHHQDATDNSGQCVNCHIAVPHGWKAPRLLVDAEEGEEYSPDAFLVEGGVKVREGMNSLAGLNNHPLVGSDGMPAYVTGSGSGTPTLAYSLEGTALWDESQCSACGDHYGEDQKFYNASTNAFQSTDDGNNKSDTAIPVRITF